MNKITNLTIGAHKLDSKWEGLEPVFSRECIVEIFVDTEKGDVEYKDVWNGWVYIEIGGVTVMSFRERNPSQGVADYISSRIENLIIEGLRLGIAERLIVGNRFYSGGINSQQIHNQLEKYTREIIKRSKSRLYIPPEQSGRKAKYVLVRLNSHYKILQPIWKVAKSDSKKAQMNPMLSERWRQRIKNSFKTKLPKDLIEWLNVSDQERYEKLLSFSKLTNLQEKLKDGYALSKPSDIAMEHSARLCGAPPYNYAVSTLWGIWRKQEATTKKKNATKKPRLKAIAK
jgi:hypothetical protein